MNKILSTIAALALFIVPASASTVNITVDVSKQTMYVQTPGDDFTWKVSTAGRGHHTPRGTFKPYRLEAMHYSKKYNNAPMPHSIFFQGGYAIHATKGVGKLGTPASHGCVRLSPQNARWLYRLVQQYGAKNTTITIHE